MKKLLAVVAGAAVLLTGGVARTSWAGAAEVPAYHPARLAHVGDAEQLVVVTGRSRTSSHATLRTYHKGPDGAWTERFPAMPARNGYGGWVPAGQRVQDTGTTPQGTFTLTTAFGLDADPGTALPYRRVDADDHWAGDERDPKTYNLFQAVVSPVRTWRTQRAERLAAYPAQYRYAAVIDFNRPDPATVTWDRFLRQYRTSRPADVRRGSAIFLHVNGAGSTAGCVSVARADMVSVLTWLNPARLPRIVMAPEAEIGTA